MVPDHGSAVLRLGDAIQPFQYLPHFMSHGLCNSQRGRDGIAKQIDSVAQPIEAVLDGGRLGDLGASVFHDKKITRQISAIDG